MRIVVAGLIGGLVFFFWGAIAHMALGLGDRGMRYGTAATTTLAAMKAEVATPGIHALPLEFVLGNLTKYVLGWTLAGAAMARWLGRGR